MLLVLQAGSDLYAFVEFAQHNEAQLALMAMNKRIVLGRVTDKFYHIRVVTECCLHCRLSESR